MRYLKIITFYTIFITLNIIYFCIFFSDPANDGHLKSYRTLIEDGSADTREIDDWLPRANIKLLYREGKISLEDKESIEEFAHKFCVKEEYVIAYVSHLQDLKNQQDIRSRNRKETSKKRHEQTYDDYNWEELAMNAKLGKLLVHELDKYLAKHNLSKAGKKKDKVTAKFPVM